MSSPRTILSRFDVLEWNPRWQESDRGQLKAFLEGQGKTLTYKPNLAHLRPRLDAVIATIPDQLDTIYRTRSNGSVKGLDANRKRLFDIRPGAIDLGMGIDRTILEFTTTHWVRGRTPHRPVEVPTTACPVHNMQLPATGVCDQCE
ncbi:hypothetical protein ACI3ET_01250 [Ornithinimicrobium sp. LYQ121]|uniref:hypothetical protein n=1 Tax=Ornithinimicrobium sp. LYQ121 TaxID=3378801 RepID=UPI003852242F